MNTWWLVIVAVAFLTAGAFGVAEEKPSEAVKTPTLRIPKLAKAPVTDGRIETEEWKGSAAVTGFNNNGPDGGMSLPQFLQPVWYLAYDDNNFYLAFHYPVYPKGSLRAACKTKSLAEGQEAGMSILWDDHTEIEICTVGRDKALSGYFFKFMTNPWDIISDQKVRYSIGQMGYEYDTGAMAKSVFNESSWDQEIAIPLKDLGVTQIKDGDRWVVQLVSAQDPLNNYFAWIVASWLQFDQFHEVIFDSKAAAVQFTGVGNWMEGNPDFTFRVFNPQKHDVSLDVGVKIVAADGKVLLDKIKPVAVKAGELKEEHVTVSGLPLGGILTEPAAKRNNHVYLKVADTKTGALYYEHDMPLSKGQSPDVQAYLKNLKDARKPAVPKLQFAYLPSYNRLKVSTDVGILGIDPRIGKDAKCLSAWFAKGGEVIGKNSMPFSADGTASLVFNFQPLAEGTYDITMEIQDANGKPLVSKKDTFERKIFPFENFKLGLDETVVKPYTPIKVEGRTFETVGSRLELTAAGLVAGIRNKLTPEEGGPNIMAGPMNLVAVQNGKTTKLGAADKAFVWVDAGSSTKISGVAESRLAGLTFKLAGEAEYTGQYLVNLDIVPNGKVGLDRFELEIPISDPVDTCYSFSPRDSMLLYTKEHPWTGAPKEGELWNNLAERASRPHIMYVGNGERGLYWYTDSYEGFWIDRNKPHIFIEKRKDCTVLRVAFFNKPVVLDHPRHIRFAVFAVPSKPLPADARAMQWNSFRMQIGCASWWGTIGCFTLPLNDQEWQAWIAGKPLSYKGKSTPGAFPIFYAKRATDGRWLLEKGHEYGVYRAADYIGYLQPEFKVFSGEWVDVTNPPLAPEANLLRYKDKDENPIWPEPEQRSVHLRDACVPSMYDYEAYYFYLMGKNTGNGGYWWDWNSLVEGKSLDKGTMYLNDQGLAETRLNLFLVRSFYHRIARIVQALNIPDTNNSYAPGVVFQMPWLTRLNSIESMYLESKLNDMFDEHGVDRYRMQIGKYSGIPVQILMNIPIDFKNHRARTVLALALLHDNGIAGVDGNQPGMELLQKAGVMDESAKWIPYWRSQKTVSASKPGLLITAYKNDLAKRLTLVVVNPGESDVETDITVTDGGKAADVETGTVFSGGGERISKVTVNRHDFRLITVQQ